MTLTINVIVALLIAIGLSVGQFLIGGRHESKAAHALASAELALGTVRDPLARQSVQVTAADWEGALSRILRVLSPEQALVRATALRITLAQRLLPVGLSILALGVMAGFLRRDRARDLVLYSSVTFSYVGKFLALTAIAYGFFVALSPFAPPLWTLYPAMGVAASGAATYVGNLPPKL